VIDYTTEIGYFEIVLADILAYSFLKISQMLPLRVDFHPTDIRNVSTAVHMVSYEYPPLPALLFTSKGLFSFPPQMLHLQEVHLQEVHLQGLHL
jgi:hypothetical protein